MLDPATTFILATLFMLLNGAVIGFIHRALPKAMQASAADWRIGTLLLAGCSLLFASRGIRPIDWIIPVANGLLFVGITLYWRALRRFYFESDTWLIFIPSVFGTICIAVFTFAIPHFSIRVMFATAVGCAITMLAFRELVTHRKQDRTVSAVVLGGIFLFVSIALLARGVFIFFNSTPVDSLLAKNNPVNALTPMLIAVLPVVGTTTFVLLLFERIRRDLNRMATTDELTSLANRRSIAESANAALSNARSVAGQFAVALIDVDHFKQINDRYGHAAGDVVLANIAKVLEKNCRAKQVVGRQGGEEFVVLLHDTTLDEARLAAQRLRSAVEQTRHEIDGKTVATTISIGVAALEEGDKTFDDLLRRADRALYAAKSAGRNCVGG
jgi:diguanylate cyclase (GGDEF)-like protein